MHLGHFALVEALHGLGLVAPSAPGEAEATGGGEPTCSDGGLGDGGGDGGGASWDGTAAVVVSSDFSRLGGFHDSLLGALANSDGAGEGDLRGEVHRLTTFKTLGKSTSESGSSYLRACAARQKCKQAAGLSPPPPINSSWSPGDDRLARCVAGGGARGGARAPRRSKRGALRVLRAR